VNASIRLPFALVAALVSALFLPACAGGAQEGWNPPRTYRESLVVELAPLRSAEQTSTVLQRSHERGRPARERTVVTTGR
jgi:hypothetical protein